ncbi:toxin HicA [Pseudaquabacterium pictum]|nr:toxin HicA [Rubrivivax pictus]
MSTKLGGLRGGAGLALRAGALTIGVNSDTISAMANIVKVLAQMESSPGGVRFADLVSVCEHFFGAARQSGSSHAVFKTPWAGDPRVNIQNDKGKAKAYQVRQVLQAIAKLKGQGNEL